jgi:ankyrin repeat protein
MSDKHSNVLFANETQDLCAIRDIDFAMKSRCYYDLPKLLCEQEPLVFKVAYLFNGIGMTIFMRACSFKYVPNSILKKLIELGSDVNACYRGKKAIHFAIDYGCTNAVAFLIEHGLHIHARDVSGYTPLHLACLNLNEDIIDLLIKAGGDVNEVHPVNGRTPLHSACEYSNAEGIKLLLAAGANVMARRKDGKTPLHDLCKANCVNGIDLLVSYGADVHARDNRGKTPIFSAITHMNEDVLKHLIEKYHVDVNVESKNKQTAFEYIWEALKPEQLLYLIRNGARCTTKMFFKITYYNYVNEGNVKMLKLSEYAYIFTMMLQVKHHTKHTKSKLRLLSVDIFRRLFTFLM